MPRITNAQLTDANMRLQAQVKELTDQIAQLKARCACSDDLRSRSVNALTKQVKRIEQQRSIVPVYEWNPDVPGDFARALAEAKLNNGRVQRMRKGVPA